jgi:hypothetical protein
LHPPVFNLVISNIPGPPIDLFCAGARVAGIFPMGPVVEDAGLNLTVLSEAHHLNVGIMACPELVPGSLPLAHSDGNAAPCSARRRDVRL